MADHVHDENCDHDGDDEGDIEITIQPRDEDLERIGVSPEEFETALNATLEAFDKSIDADDPEAATPLEDAEIVLAGQAYRLQEVADIEISGDIDGLDEFDDDEDDDDIEDEDGPKPDGEFDVPAPDRGD